MPRDLPPYRFELRYPSDDLDDGEDNGPEELGAPPDSYEVLRAQTTEDARLEAARLWEARHPADASVMLSGEAIGGASIPAGSAVRRRQTDIGRC